MGYAVSLALIAAGAILRWAVTATTSGFNIHVAGDVLMVVGVIGFLLSLLYWGLWLDRNPPTPPKDL